MNKDGGRSNLRVCSGSAKACWGRGGKKVRDDERTELGRAEVVAVELAKHQVRATTPLGKEPPTTYGF